MALIKCSECGKEISDRAGACPGCGAPVNGSTATAPSSAAVTKSVRVERAGFKWEAIGFVLILVAMFTGIAGAGGFAGLLGLIGFVVFIIGRLID
ncbi:MAG: zinc ribbon domain-containing protein [Xanthomonadales bacterium]|nr:zinc ribbon domain-containing protein [Xanthomonadales bacterium]